MKIFDRIRAFFRGESKIKGASRGRCLVKKSGEPDKPTGHVQAQSKHKVTVTARVIRKNGDVEDLGVVGHG